MKLFKLEHTNPEETHDYDIYQGFIIRAEDEYSARLLAQSFIADEKYFHRDFWMDPEYSSCNELFIDIEGESEIILSDFLHG